VILVVACGPAADRNENDESVAAIILEPADGAVIQAASVRVVLGASGIEIAPADQERPRTGHHHIYVDRELTPDGEVMPQGEAGLIHLGRAQTEHTIEGLAPGEHVIIARLGDWQHVPVPAAATDTVRFTLAP
jgi:hypothetical protein